MERTGIEPVTSDLQIPGYEPRLGQIRSVKAKVRWLGEVEIGYSGTRVGTRFSASRGGAASAEAWVGCQPRSAGQVRVPSTAASGCCRCDRAVWSGRARQHWPNLEGADQASVPIPSSSETRFRARAVR